MSGLTITDRFDEGLAHAVAASPVQREIGDLPAGGIKQVAIEFRVIRAGAWRQIVEVAQGAAVRVSAKSCLTTEDLAALPPPAPSSGH